MPFHHQRRNGEPLRVYMDLEASRKPSGFEDIFIGYHAKDDVQTTYAGSLFRNNRNFHISTQKRNVSLSEFHYQIQRLWYLIILFRCDWDFLHVYHYYFNQGAVFVCYLIAYYVFFFILSVLLRE